MKKRILITAIVLITILASLSYSAPLANDSDLNRAIDTAELFLKQCADNMYLYQDNDISKITTSSFDTGRLSKVSSEAVKLSDDMTKSNSVNSYITVEEFPNFIEQKVNYFKKFRSERNIEREKFKVDYYIKNSSINGNFAFIEIIEDINFFYKGSSMSSSIQTDYNVLLYKEDKEWLVCNIKSDDDFDRYYKEEKLTFDKLNSEAKKETERLNSPEYKKINSEIKPKGLAEVLKERIDNDNKNATLSKTIASSTGIIYNAYNVACYALTYSRNGIYENVSGGNYNPNFPNYSSYGGDCQNFVSQCIWAGFNGSNDPNAINGLLRPMDSDYPQWYCSGSGYKTSSWTVPSAFDTYTNDTGKGTRIKNTKKSYPQLPNASAFQIGDEVIVNGGGHAIIIVDIDSNGAYYCAHTANSRRVRLNDYFSGGYKIIRPESYLYSKLYSDGGNHTFSSIPTIYGSDASCNNSGCSHNRMQVSGDYWGPMLSSPNMSVWIHCSILPYRVAIGIKHENSSKTTWFESLHTANAYTTYNFTTPGLYTITLSARDKDPKEYSDSMATTVKYTLRVLTEQEFNEYYH